jgi:hypothetical protein
MKNMKKIALFTIISIATTSFGWSPYAKISSGIGFIDDAAFKGSIPAVSVTSTDEVEYESSMVLSACIGVEHQHGIFLEGVLAHQSADGNYKSDASTKVESAYTQCGLQLAVKMFEKSAIQPYMMFGMGFLFSSFEDSVGEAEDTLSYGSFSVGVIKEIASKYEMYVQFSKLSSETLADTYQSMGVEVDIETELDVAQFAIGFCGKF